MKRKYLILFSLSGLIISLDQLTKLVVQGRLKIGEEMPLIAQAVFLSHHRNSGFAFGILQRAPETLRDIFFIAVPIFALILIALIFIKLQDDQLLTSVALTTILGGALGNLIDRLQHGFVVDVITLRFGGLHLPAFNVADFSIIFGVFLMFLNMLMQPRRKERPA